jgi:hypothetical protein
MRPPKPTFWLVVAHLRQVGTFFVPTCFHSCHRLLLLLPSTLLLFDHPFFAPISEVCRHVIAASRKELREQPQNEYLGCKRISSEKRTIQMAANGREDADTSLFDAEGCLVESPL